MLCCYIECIFMGKSTVGVGASRPEAKEDAASRTLSSIIEKNEKKPARPTRKGARGPKRK